MIYKSVITLKPVSAIILTFKTLQSGKHVDIIFKDLTWPT